MEQKFNTIFPKKVGHTDYTSFDAWEASLQGESGTIHIGVLGSDSEIQIRLNEFIKHKMYQSSFCDFILMSEAGEILASFIDEKWEPVGKLR